MPADLTLLSKQNKGKFPLERVNEVLGLRPGTAAHGSREMPVWGDLFRASGQDDTVTKLRIHNIVRYLQSIQQL
jgi:hypothetical protein